MKEEERGKMRILKRRRKACLKMKMKPRREREIGDKKVPFWPPTPPQ